MSWGEVYKVNSDFSKPVNVLIMEQTLVQAVNQESIEWVFSQQAGIGIMLNSYFGLNAGTILNPLTTIHSIAASGDAMNVLAGSTTAMNVLAGSTTAMNAIASNSVARKAIRENSSAMTKVSSSEIAIGKFVAGEAGLNPSSYQDIHALAASQSGMSAVANSSVAMSAVANSSLNTSKTILLPSESATSITSGKMLVTGMKVDDYHTSERNITLTTKITGMSNTMNSGNTGQTISNTVMTNYLISLSNPKVSLATGQKLDKGITFRYIPIN